MNINDIIARSESLRKETALNSIDPERVGSIMSDTLKWLNEFQLTSNSLGLDKIYSSVDEMNSDAAPVSDLTGKPLKAGQLAVIVASGDEDEDNGKVYRFDNPGWTYVSIIGNLNIVQSLGDNENSVVSQLITTDLGLQNTPFTAIGYSETNSDPFNANNRKLWSNFFKAIEIPDDVLKAALSNEGDNPYPTETTFWSFAEGVWTTTDFLVNIYRNDGGWKLPYIRLSFSKAEASKNLLRNAVNGWATFAVRADIVSGSMVSHVSKIFVTVDLDSWPSQNVTELTNIQLASRIRPECFEKDYFPSIREWKISVSITPGEYQRPFLFKNNPLNIQFSEIFFNCFYDIKINVDKEPDAHYGFVYLSYRFDEERKCTGAYFENYYWKIGKDGSPKFISLGDDFIVPSSLADEGDKLSYYKSPGGKFEFLVNWNKFFSYSSMQTTGISAIIAATTMLEFSDIVVDKLAFSPLKFYHLAGEENVDVVQYNTNTGKIIKGYIDNQLTESDMMKTFDYLDDASFAGEFFSYGIWGKVDGDGAIERVEAYVSSIQSSQIECIVKIFDSEPSAGLDLWSDQYGKRIGGKVIDPNVDIKNDILTIEIEETAVKRGQVVILFLRPVDTGKPGKVNVGIIYYPSTVSWNPIPGGTYFFWKGSYQTSVYSKSAINVDESSSEHYAYYQLPLRIYSKFPLEAKVKKLENDLETINKNVLVQNPRLVIPKRLYAIVGKEFNLYYDAFMLLPEVGTNQNNVFFNIACSIGTSIEKCFRVTPTTEQVGDYPMAITILDSYGNVQYQASTMLTVVAAENPNTEKRILMIGDSTTDDTAQVVIGLNNNLNDLTGGVKPLLVGHKTYYSKDEIKHGAATGKTLDFYANGMTVLKFNVASGVPQEAGNYPNLTLRLPDDSGYIVSIETTNNGDGSGSIIANVWTEGSAPIGTGFAGQLKTNGAAGWPSTIDVISTEQLNAWSPIRFDGEINFTRYAEHIGLSTDEPIDLLSVDLGINDSRGALQNENAQMNKIECAIAIAEAFHAYNPNGKVMFCLPKSCAAPRSRSNSNHDIYRMNIQRMRELYLEYFNGNADRPYCYVCGSGLAIDRYWGYSLQTVPAAARYPDNLIQVNIEDVHPRTEGYYQVADVMVGCMIYLLNN